MSCIPRVPRATHAAVQISDPEIERLLADLPLEFPRVVTLIEGPITVGSNDQFSAPTGTPVVNVPVASAPVSTPGKPRSGARRPRKSKERDARNGRTMQRLDPRTATNRKRALVAAPLLNPSISPSLLNRPKTKRQRADERDKRLMAAWRHIGDINKMKAMSRAVEEIGAMAFTLNLSENIVAKASVNPRKAKTFLSDRLTKTLARHFSFPVDFAFVLEFTPGGRLHLHGIIVIDRSRKKLAKQALMEAGGNWNAAHPEFQADARKLWSGDGWANYCDKSSTRTKKALGLDGNASVLSATQNLRRQGEAYWEGLRAAEKLDRSTRKQMVV